MSWAAEIARGKTITGKFRSSTNGWLSSAKFQNPTSVALVACVITVVGKHDLLSNLAQQRKRFWPANKCRVYGVLLAASAGQFPPQIPQNDHLGGQARWPLPCRAQKFLN
jgi:hypothetical protein